MNVDKILTVGDSCSTTSIHRLPRCIDH